VSASLVVAPAPPRGLVQSLLLDPDKQRQEQSDAPASFGAREDEGDARAADSEPGEQP
jgi:hypothetical protein